MKDPDSKFPTAVQEIYALFMAQAILVPMRMEADTAQDFPIIQVSFENVLAVCRHLCCLWTIEGDPIKPDAWARIGIKSMREIAWQAS